jgi:hypothetical protein
MRIRSKIFAHPTPIRNLFYLIAAIWLAFGFVSLLRAQQHGNLPLMIAVLLGILMFGNAAALFWMGWGIGKEPQGYYYPALVLIVVNIILTFTDEFGFFDGLTLLIDLVILALLLAGRPNLIAGKQDNSSQT